MQNYDGFQYDEWIFFVVSETSSDISAIVRNTVRKHSSGLEKCTQKHSDDIFSSQCLFGFRIVGKCPIWIFTIDFADGIVDGRATGQTVQFQPFGI
jgi:hypothetical protein